jgi:hypothetical protein
MNRVRPHSPATGVLLLLAGAAVLGWIWSCFCQYPAQDWNALRLAPSFMLRAGLSAYPGPLDGPVTTWIYGPVPIILQLPATLAGNATAALLAAAGLNLIITFVPLWIAVRCCRPAPASRETMAWAFLLAAAAWPAAHLMFFQADNPAVAFGLLGMAALAGADPNSNLRLWLGALAAMLALWCKQNELGPVLAQLAYLYIRHGARTALTQLVRCVAAGAALGAVLLPLFGADGLLYNMFVLPAGLPRADFFYKATHPIYRSYMLLQVVVPAAVLAFGARRFFRRDSAVLLPALMFACSLPFNLAGFASIGGNINSLHGVLYLVPAAAVWLAASVRLRSGALAAVPALVLAGLLGLQGVRQHWHLPLRPEVTALHEGEMLARQLPGQVYFPWNPLLTWFAEVRIDHAEDGFMTRLVAGRPVPSTEVFRHLPPAMCVVAYHLQVNDGFVKTLIPRAATRTQFGAWILYSWPPPGK